jgi:hypothetical protein
MNRRSFRIGAIVGGVLSLFVALGMDIISGDIPGRSWPGAVAHDLSALTGREISPSGFVAYFFALITIAFMIAVGAVMGGICGTILERFFRLFREEE